MRIIIFINQEMPNLLLYSKNYQILQCSYSAGIIRLDVYVLIFVKFDVFFTASENPLTL